MVRIAAGFNPCGCSNFSSFLLSKLGHLELLERSLDCFERRSLLVFSADWLAFHNAGYKRYEGINPQYNLDLNSFLLFGIWFLLLKIKLYSPLEKLCWLVQKIARTIIKHTKASPYLLTTVIHDHNNL